MNKYSFDVNRRGNQFTIEGLHRGDNGMRVFEFCFSSGGEPFPLPEECIATLYAHLPCGTKIFDSCDVVSDTVVYVLKGGAEGASLTVSAGKAECEIRITATDGRIITSPKFTILIDDVLQDDSAIEAEDDFSALTDALGRVLEAEEGLDSKVDKIEGAEGNVVVFGPDGELKDSGVSDPASRAYATQILNGHNSKKDDTVHPYLQEKINKLQEDKLDKAEGATGNIVVFGEGGAIADSGIDASNVASRYVFIYDETKEHNDHNRAIATQLRSDLENGKKVSVFIDDTAEVYPAALGRGSNYIEVIAYVNVGVYKIRCSTTTNNVVYSCTDTYSNSGAFNETSKIPASQELTANWVKQLIDDTIVEGAW